MGGSVGSVSSIVGSVVASVVATVVGSSVTSTVVGVAVVSGVSGAFWQAVNPISKHTAKHNANTRFISIFLSCSQNRKKPYLNYSKLPVELQSKFLDLI